MSYSIYGLDKIKSPVIIKAAGGEKEYSNGAEAAKAAYEKPQSIGSVAAEGSKIIVELAENRQLQDVSWTERPVNMFDGD